MHCVMFTFRSIASSRFFMCLQTVPRRRLPIVGNEGLVGIALFMGGETTSSRAIVQSAGLAYRLPGQRLKDEFHRNGALQ
jgi:hypothetical protein